MGPWEKYRIYDGQAIMGGGGSGAEPPEGRKDFKKFLEIGQVKLKQVNHFTKIS